MKQDVIDVLRYLYEYSLDEDNDTDINEHALRNDLAQAGFHNQPIEHALEWLDGINNEANQSTQPIAANGHHAARIYTDEEQTLLNTECRGYIYQLEHMGLLDADCRERVIERLHALNLPLIELEDLKWVILLVLFNQPLPAEADLDTLLRDPLNGNLERMEDLLMLDNASLLH